MRWLMTIMCSLWMPWVLAQPVLGEHQAAALIDKGLQAQPLIWLPFVLPYDVEQASRSEDALLLEALYRHQLLGRDKVITMTALSERGEKRKKILLLWRYHYPAAEREQSTPQGFYYGRGRLKSIRELSRPYLIGDYYYAEAYIEWYVEDLQPWLADPAFRSAPTLRRTLESETKPFEQRVYLQFDGRYWALWQGQPGML